MIEEIFITSENQVLIGDVSLYPINPEYPSHVCGNKQLTQLKVHNIFLGILYSNLDTFTILRYLEKLKMNLENRYYNLTSKTILDNYFQIRDLISYEFLKEEVLTPKLPVLSTNEIFIDIIETYNIVMDKKFSVCDVFGYCFIKPRFNEENFLKLILKKDKNIKFITDYKILGRFNKLEMELNVFDKDLQVLKYKTTGKIPFKLEEYEGGYSLDAGNMHFDSLEIHIPCSQQVKSMKIESNSGISKFIEEKDEIKWSFKKQKIGKAYLKINIENFKDEKIRRPIQIGFNIQNTDKNILNIEKAICLDNQFVDIWIRYDICNGNVEFRL